MPKDFFARARAKEIGARVRREYALGLASEDRVLATDSLARAGVKIRVKNGKTVTSQNKSTPLKKSMDRNKVLCPKCGAKVKQSNLAKHLNKVHKPVPGIAAKPVKSMKSMGAMNSKIAASMRRSQPSESMSIKPAPPGPKERMPIIVRCAICRQYVIYPKLLAHYTQSHVRELPAFTDETCEETN